MSSTRSPWRGDDRPRDSPRHAYDGARSRSSRIPAIWRQRRRRDGPIRGAPANILVGNSDGCAVLEATLQGPTLRFDVDTLVAICGGDLSPTIDGAAVPLWRPVVVRKDTTIAFGKVQSRCRSYLAIAGGFDVPLVLNSRSTYLRAKLGGFVGLRIATWRRDCRRCAERCCA